MKLEIKHLAPYLPYRLKYVDSNNNIVDLKAIDNDIHFVNFGWGDAKEYSEIKPILRPLSEFDNSEYIGLIRDYVLNKNWCDAYDDYFEIWFDDMTNVHKLVLQAPYCIFQYFLENHFDVFGLIEQNLAINKNEV